MLTSAPRAGAWTAPLNTAVRPRVPPILVTVPFVAALWLPALDRLAGLDPTPSLQENRRRAVRPSWPRSWGEAKALPAAIDAYHADHMGFRPLLVAAHGLLKLKVLGTSPSPKVLVARDGFLVHTGERALDAYRARHRMGPGALSTWARTFEERRAALASRGIAYAVLIAPEKPTVYPDVMPEYVAPLSEETRMDQLVAFLRKATSVSVVDPRAALRRARSEGNVYHRFDTHFTSFGAYVVYRELMEALGAQVPGLAPDGPSAFVRTSSTRAVGDLAALCGVRGILTEPEETWARAAARAAPSDSPVPAARVVPAQVAPVVWARPDPGPRAVVWHDSFFLTLRPFFAEHFERVVFVRNNFQPFDVGLVGEERAGVVVQELAERYLEAPLPPR